VTLAFGVPYKCSYLLIRFTSFHLTLSVTLFVYKFLTCFFLQYDRPFVMCVGVPRVQDVIASSRRALLLAVLCLPIHTGCVRRASTRPIPVRSPADSPVRCAMRLLEPRLSTRFLSQSDWRVRCVTIYFQN